MLTIIDKGPLSNELPSVKLWEARNPDKTLAYSGSIDTRADKVLKITRHEIKSNGRGYEHKTRTVTHPALELCIKAFFAQHNRLKGVA